MQLFFHNFTGRNLFPKRWKHTQKCLRCKISWNIDFLKNCSFCYFCSFSILMDQTPEWIYYMLNIFWLSNALRSWKIMKLELFYIIFQRIKPKNIEKNCEKIEKIKIYFFLSQAFLWSCLCQKIRFGDLSEVLE